MSRNTRATRRSDPAGRRTPRLDVPSASSDERPPAPTREAGPSMLDATMQKLTEAITAAVAPKREPPYIRMHQLGAVYFDGKAAPLEADTWMGKMEQIYGLLECTEEEKVACTRSLFQGSASYWWKSVERRLAGTTPVTWEVMRKEFEEYYLPQSFKDARMIEFTRLVQGSMTVAEYESKFIELSRFAPSLVSTEWDKCRRFEQGLKESVRTSVVAIMHSNYGQLVQAALRVEFSKDEGKADRDKAKQGTEKRADREEDDRPSKRTKPFMPPRLQYREREGSSLGGMSRSSRRDYPQCGKCGKRHLGECMLGKGACFRCGERGHMMRFCPLVMQQGSQVGGSSRPMSVGGEGSRGGEPSHANAARRNEPLITPRVFAMTSQNVRGNQGTKFRGRNLNKGGRM
jgi:hypothetical protein